MGRGVVLGCVVLCGVLMGGCEQEVLGTSFGGLETERRGGGDEDGGGGFLEGLFGGGKRGSRSGEDAAGAWAILLARYEGLDHEKEAAGLALRLSGVAKGEAWVDTDEVLSVSSVYYGRYESVSSGAAQADMLYWRELRRQRRVVTDTLLLTPIAKAGGTGANPEWNLVTVGSRISEGYVGDAYSIQVGYFDDGYEGDRRDAAEGRAAELRELGEEAFYYHGPNVSMVTIGVFSEADVGGGRFDGDGHPLYGERIEEVRGRYPLNLGNGVPVAAESGLLGGAVSGNQRSGVVIIPR